MSFVGLLVMILSVALGVWKAERDLAKLQERIAARDRFVDGEIRLLSTAVDQLIAQQRARGELDAEHARLMPALRDALRAMTDFNKMY